MKAVLSNAICVCFALLLTATTLHAATFVVPPDREMLRRADALVIGSALTSYSQWTNEGSIETVTPISIHDVIKGEISGDTINLHEPGGRLDEIAVVIHGVPTFEPGQRVLLFLTRIGNDRWAVTDLALGKFLFATDQEGREVAVRAESEIEGWSIDGQPHEEPRRDAEKFTRFLMAEARGERGVEDYHVPRTTLEPKKSGLKISTHSTHAPNTYLSSGNFRWNSFPQSYFTGAANVTGAAGGGVTGTIDALAAWTNHVGSAITIQHGGTSVATNGVLGAADGVNSVLFERNLTSWGAPAFNCGVGGVLGIGQIRATGTHIGPGGTLYATAYEGDVEMNQGISGCAWVVSDNGARVWKNALAHELGHSIGFRHADQGQANGSACTPASMECIDGASGQAVMRSSLPTTMAFGLQTWDSNAASAVYPTGGAAPPAPTNVLATATGSTSVSVSWTASSGATQYRIHRCTALASCAQIGTSATTSFNDAAASANTAYLYKVRAFDGTTESADSAVDLATTVIFTDPTITAGVTTLKAAHVTELRTAVNAVRVLAGLGATAFTDASLAGIASKAIHMTEIRTTLNAARTALSLSTISYTDPTITAGSTPIKAAHITQLRNGVQ
jgi:hypothetical protein